MILERYQDRSFFVTLTKVIVEKKSAVFQVDCKECALQGSSG